VGANPSSDICTKNVNLFGIGGERADTYAPEMELLARNRDRLSPVGALVCQPHVDGTTDLCEVWPGPMRTNAGQTIDFYVESHRGWGGEASYASRPPTPVGRVWRYRLAGRAWRTARMLARPVYRQLPARVESGQDPMRASQVAVRGVAQDRR
jgi:hypothetical protein